MEVDISNSQGVKLHANLEEAANRAEVTSMLLRAGFRVYRPEADVGGEDLILRTPDGLLIPVQMKARPMIDPARYGKLWMLFPDPKGQKPGRKWFLIPHDILADIFQSQRKLTWKEGDAWSYAQIPTGMMPKLEPYSDRHWRKDIAQTTESSD